MKKIIWADDEIELLKPHVLYLEQKGYQITTVTNGDDAISLCRKEPFDAILLDEMMPGKDGLQTLQEIKEYDPSIKIIMITKSEEESIMEDAIGGKIDDYLIKPINPSQVYMSLKKNLETKEISTKKIYADYLSELNNINFKLMNENLDTEDWYQLNEKIIKYSIDLDNTEDTTLKNTLHDIKKEANSLFAKFVTSNYEEWSHSKKEDRPVFSNDIVESYIVPKLKQKEKSVLILFDCLRFDQAVTLQEHLYTDFYIQQDSYLSLLPTATAYSRNAIFAGLFPDEFNRIIPNFWEDAVKDDRYNAHEDRFLDQLLRRNGLQINFKYFKCSSREDLQQVEEKWNENTDCPFIVVVINFLDFITHSRMESKLLQEMIPNDTAYRKIAKQWYSESPISAILKKIQDSDFTNIFITTDHGAIQSNKAVKVGADKEVSDNLRFKFGRSLNVDKKSAVIVRDPSRFRLPKHGISTDYIFAKDSSYFIYPSNYNKYANQYLNSYQHGGISMEEMIVPILHLKGKK
jgi:DNA-binding response OmpR family regulator